MTKASIDDLIDGLADELRLLQTVSQVAATELSLVRSFPKIQQLTRRLVAWEGNRP